MSSKEPSPTETWLTETVFTVDDFLTPEECDEFIGMAEDVGFEEATVIGPRGAALRKDVRNNERVMFRSDDIAEWLWERAADFIVQEIDDREAVGVNEMLRFYRYDPGQQFDWHQDGPFNRENDERTTADRAGEGSLYTFMIYLNDNFEGGETSFEDSYSEESFDPFSVTPRRGTALFFEHAVHHKGEPVTSGRKYVLRTDVMYAAAEEWETGDPEDTDVWDDGGDEW